MDGGGLLKVFKTRRAHQPLVPAAATRRQLIFALFSELHLIRGQLFMVK
jgi:hypothetical protein